MFVPGRVKEHFRAAIVAPTEVPYSSNGDLSPASRFQQQLPNSASRVVHTEIFGKMFCIDFRLVPVLRPY